jgi:hypothetical protein
MHSTFLCLTALSFAQHTHPLPRAWLVERGTTTPFDMVVVKEMRLCHSAIDALGKSP